MIDLGSELGRQTGRKGNAANATGSVLARLSELLTNRITSARAAFLDAAISSLAVASTAISNAVWTATMAGRLDAAVSSRASSIKSIQAGTISLIAVASNTATITSVNTAKSVLIFLGNTYGAADANTDSQHGRLALTNGTTITATRQASVSVIVVSYIIFEFN